jgi:high-affinity iron transporter
MFNALFVIWRECFEVILIVGIIYASIKKDTATPQELTRSLKYLWSGFILGVIGSLVFARALESAQTELEGLALEVFESALLVIAAILMTHMCLWMRKHAPKLKGEIQNKLTESRTSLGLWGVMLITAIAVFREGFEIVMFLSSMLIEAKYSGQYKTLVAGITGGFLLSLATAWIYIQGLKIFKPKIFFNVTSFFLLVTSASLLLAATRKMIQSDLIPTLQDQVWDTSFILDERTNVGQFISLFTGYESNPSLMVILVYGGYWLITLMLFQLTKTRKSITHTNH